MKGRIRNYCFVAATIALANCPAGAKAQIVNVESARMQSDTTGWKGNFGATFSYTKNVSEILQFDINTHVQYKTKKNLYLLLGNYTFLRGANKELINNTFFHLRYNRTITEILKLEAFTQVQSNVVTGIRQRFLAGAGPRFKISSSGTFRLYAATLFMYEEEKESSEGANGHNDFRNSSYVSFTYKPNNVLELVSTSFYQPLVRDISDFRILNEEVLKLTATKRLAFTLNWNYLYDSHPAKNIPNTNFVFSTGFVYGF